MQLFVSRTEVTHQENATIKFSIFDIFHPDLVLNNSKKKENHTPRSSTGSVLTFSNPNYNLPDDGSASEPKVKIWKRLKYDKAQV